MTGTYRMTAGLSPTAWFLSSSEESRFGNALGLPDPTGRRVQMGGRQRLLLGSDKLSWPARVQLKGRGGVTSERKRRWTMPLALALGAVACATTRVTPPAKPVVIFPSHQDLDRLPARSPRLQAF